MGWFERLTRKLCSSYMEGLTMSCPSRCEDKKAKLKARFQQEREKALERRAKVRAKIAEKRKRFAKG